MWKFWECDIIPLSLPFIYVNIYSFVLFKDTTVHEMSLNKYTITNSSKDPIPQFDYRETSSIQLVLSTPCFLSGNTLLFHLFVSHGSLVCSVSPLTYTYEFFDLLSVTPTLFPSSLISYSSTPSIYGGTPKPFTVFKPKVEVFWKGFIVIKLVQGTVH